MRPQGSRIELDPFSRIGMVVGVIFTMLLAVYAVNYDSLQIGLAFMSSFGLLVGGIVIGRLRGAPSGKPRAGAFAPDAEWWAILLAVFAFVDFSVPAAFGFLSAAGYLSTVSASALLQVGTILAVANGVSESSFFPYGLGNFFASLGRTPSVALSVVLVGLSASAYHLAAVPMGPDLLVIFMAFAAMTYAGFRTGKLWPVIAAHVTNNLAVFGYSVLVLHPAAQAALLAAVHLIY